MTIATKSTPEITRAAERYLEQYGDPLVMNTYLKVIILVLAVVCLALAALVFRGQKALADMHPLIVRISDLAAILGVDDKHIYRMAARGQLPSFRVGGAVRFDPQEVAKWLRTKYGQENPPERKPSRSAAPAENRASSAA